MKIIISLLDDNFDELNELLISSTIHKGKYVDVHTKLINRSRELYPELDKKHFDIMVDQMRGGLKIRTIPEEDL